MSDASTQRELREGHLRGGGPAIYREGGGVYMLNEQKMLRVCRAQLLVV
jgi:hypothetical protein